MELRALVHEGQPDFFSLSLSLLYHRDKRQQQRNGSASFSLLCWVESASMRVTVGQTSQFITISLPASIPKVNWKHSSNQYRTHPLCLFASVCWFGERRELYLDLNLVALVSCLIFLSLLYFYFNVAQFLLLLPCFFFSLSCFPCQKPDHISNMIMRHRFLRAYCGKSVPSRFFFQLVSGWEKTRMFLFEYFFFLYLLPPPDSQIEQHPITPPENGNYVFVRRFPF